MTVWTPISAPHACPKVKIECTNNGCSLKLFREELAAHQCVCPKQMIDCPYSVVGCTAQLLREHRQAHLQENIEQHAIVGTNKVLSLESELQDVREQLMEAKCLLPPVTFKMTNYRQKKERNILWRSPGFYTHQGGYKMKMKVFSGGEDDRCRGYLSVFCHLIQGRNDDYLEWPFSAENSITIQILNQSRDSNHFTRGFNWSIADEEVRQISAVGNACWGIEKFISHSKLESEGNSFLVNDCVYFRVSKVTIAKSWLTCSA